MWLVHQRIYLQQVNQCDSVRCESVAATAPHAEVWQTACSTCVMILLGLNHALSPPMRPCVVRNGEIARIHSEPQNIRIDDKSYTQCEVSSTTFLRRLLFFFLVYYQFRLTVFVYHRLVWKILWNSRVKLCLMVHVNRLNSFLSNVFLSFRLMFIILQEVINYRETRLISGCLTPT